MSVGSRVSQGVSAGLSKLRRGQQRRSEERFAERFAQQWATMRAERRADEPIEHPGRGVQLQPRAGCPTASTSPRPGPGGCWSWSRAGSSLARGIAMFAVVVLPLVIALLLAALVAPVVDAAGAAAAAARGIAALLVVIGSIARRRAAADLRRASRSPAAPATWPARWSRASSRSGTGCKTGPLHASDSQINAYIQTAQDAVTSSQHARSSPGVTEVGTALGHVVAGLLHRAVRDVLLPRRRRPHLGLGGADLPARRPRARRLLGPGRLDLAHRSSCGPPCSSRSPTRSA